MTTKGSASPPDAEPDEATLERSRAEELAWATAHFPEIGRYASIRELDERKAALLSWAEPGQSITVFDRACRPALVTRYDEELMGFLSREMKRTRASIWESYDQISMGIRMNEFGCNSVEYERDAARKWVVVSSGGIGCWRSFGLALSRVVEDAAWYDAAMVSLSIDCNEVVVDETPCSDGKSKVCSRCEGWKVTAHSLEANFGMSRQPSVRRVKLAPVDRCDVSCAVDTPPLDVQRANVALRGHQFLHTIDLDPHPFVFRTKAACQAYRKVHRLGADEAPWEAGNRRPIDLPPPSLPEE